jgi:hypothetical protein
MALMVKARGFPFQTIQPRGPTKFSPLLNINIINI